MAVEAKVAVEASVAVEAKVAVEGVVGAVVVIGSVAGGTVVDASLVEGVVVEVGVPSLTGAVKLFARKYSSRLKVLAWPIALPFRLVSSSGT